MREVRNPRNVFVVIFDSIIFLISYAQAIVKGLFDSVEKPLFEAIDNLPNSFHSIFYALTHFDGLTALFFWAAAAWYVVKTRHVSQLAQWVAGLDASQSGEIFGATGQAGSVYRADQIV